VAGDAHKPVFLIEIAIESSSKAEHEKLGAALAKLVAEDPLFDTVTDAQSGQTILRGVGESQLVAKIDMLKHVYEVDFLNGAPQVAYRETITHPATVDYTYKKPTGAHGQFARIKIVAEPNGSGLGFAFENRLSGQIPQEFIREVKTGLESQLSSGVIAGFPVQDVKVTLVDGAAHDVDSSATAFETCARAAMREALQKAGPTLLEPIMKVEVVTPAEHAGRIVADLKARRGQIHRQEIRGGSNVITAMVSLANMFAYADALCSLSQAQATFAMQFDRYAPRPDDDDPPFRPAVGMRA
jgi:elongation factor G